MRQSILMNRFGYGLGPTPSRIPKDTEGWLTSQMETKATRVHTALPEMSSAEVVASLREAQQESKMARKEVKKALSKQAALDAKASLYRAISSTTPFAERWVHFWLNHFTVSTVRKEVRGFTGAFEREVIRPYCFGHFSDLLLQVTRHPAMLLYLDNVRSVGPSSVAGRKNRGLNENLAREILELHTLGPDGGYDQSDVEQFARVLTGWSVSRESTPSEDVFVFRARAHEPGTKTVLGRRYGEGLSEGVRCLRDLSRASQTAQFVATKIARHFVSNFPSKALVHAIAHAFEKTDGDLREVAQTLIHHPDAQQPTLAKVRTPFEWIVGMAQMSGGVIDVNAAFRAVRQLSQIPFSAPSPKGWPEEVAAWIGPEATLARLDVAERFGNSMARTTNAPTTYLRDWLKHASSHSRAVIDSAPNPNHMWALFVLSPEFQRR